MKKISLSGIKGKGLFALVDDDYYEYLNQWTWHYSGRYVRRTFRREDGKQSTISMQRQVMQTPPGMDTDHINGNTLDNQKSNLRICTHAENMMNQGKRVNNTSEYKGVTWHKHKQKWSASIYLPGKRLHLGDFTDKKAAAAAVNAALSEHHGPYANLNVVQ